MPKQKAELKTFTVRAVIPTAQYGNMQPEYEIASTSFEEAEKLALPYIEKLWDRYCSKGSELKTKETEDTSKKKVSTRPADLVTLTGTLTDSKALYSDSLHKYWNPKTGKVMTGGSTIAKRYHKDFDKDKIAGDMAERINASLEYEKEFITAEDIKEMWKVNGEASMSLGTAIHKGLELYGKFQKLGLLTGANKKPAINSALHLNSVIAKAVTKFYENRGEEDAVYEEFVCDEKTDLCGQLDRVLIVDRGKKILRVQDFKTNTDIAKKNSGKLLTPFESMADTTLNRYWIQLSDYSELLKRKGWTVEAMDIFHWDCDKEEWTTYTKEPLNMAEVM